MSNMYIDRIEYHAEMVKSKKSGKLTDRAVSLFQLHAKEVSRTFYFEFEEDREDAVSSAVHDFLSYWRNFKECNVLQLKIVRNFQEGEWVEIDVKNHKKVRYVARQKPTADSDFQIGQTENRSLQSLDEAVKRTLKGAVESSLHKVTQKINLMDTWNGDDLKITSEATIGLTGKEILIKDEKDWKQTKSYVFKSPPNSFNFLTSYARNGIIKYLNTHHPKATRNGKKILFSQMNTQSGDGGAYNV